MPINSFLYPAPSTPTFAYDVANSLRFDDGSSDNLVRTNASATNNTKYTLSAWVKRSTLGTNQSLLYNWYDGSSHAYIFFATDDKLAIYDQLSGTDNINMKTSAVFRDVSAWYHIVVAVDTTESTQADRVKVYINGVEDPIGTRSAQPGSSASLGMKTNSLSNYMAISSFVNNSSTYLDGYICEYVYIDGQALAHTDLGEFDSDSPTIWKPKDVSGLTFGNNGFYLDFEDSSSLGNDAAGSNNFSVNNLTAIDQCTDTCTNNFATFNGALGYNSTIVLAEGNLKGTTGSTHEALTQSIFSSIGVTQGKWYAEFKVTTNSNHSLVGISADMESDADGSSGSAYSFIYLGQGLGYYGSNGKIFHTNSDTQMTYGSAVSNNDIVGVALDVDNQEVYFSINGTFQNSGNPASGSSKTGGVVNEGARNIFSTGTGTLFFVVADHDRDSTCAIEANFGGGSVSAISSGNSDANGYGNFEYSVPSGYYSLCTKNLAEYG